MLTTPRKTALLPAVPFASILLVTIAAGCQSTKPAPAAAAPAAAPAAGAAIQLQPYTASDQSASAGVPAGWKVTMGQQTAIQMSGPNGETVFLGNTLIARDGPYQPGHGSTNGIDLSMPYSAPLPQKLAMILQHSASAPGKVAAVPTIDSATPLQLPPAIGQCGRFVADAPGQQGPMKLLAVFCSLPIDSGHTYKNIMLLAEAPAATAGQSAPTAQAIFQSYRIPAAWLQRKLAPNTPPPTAGNAAMTAAAAAAINRSTIISEAGADNSANCFDLTVLRETPTYQLPRSCGGTRPD